jgi:hypothetical protein
MYSSIESSSSVKSNCGCAKSNPYYPSTTNTMDVSFHPVKNESGTQHYIALIENENDNEKVKIPLNMKINDSMDSLDSIDYKDDYTHLNILNGTPSGVPLDVSRVTLPINQLKSTVIFDDRSNSNVHRCKKDEFSLDNDYIKTFYIGSITVVGLYILFRILDKSR